MASLQTLFDLADPRIRKIWDEKTTQISQSLEYTNLGFTDWEAEIRDPKFENFTGLGLAQQTGEKQAYTREDIEQAGQVTISPVKFTNSIDITEEMLRFNLWPQINNLVEAVANSLNARVDTNAAKIYYLGFGTTFFTGNDGLALYSAVHPMLDGTTQSNYLGAVPLTYDNIKVARQNLDMMYDDKGIRLKPGNMKTLIVPQTLYEKAYEVLKSIGNPDSANRLSNVFATSEGQIRIVVSNYIPNTAAFKYNWFLIDNERATKMNYMVWGWRNKFDSDKAINNGTKIYNGSVMFQPGFQSFQWTVGSDSLTIV